MESKIKPCPFCGERAFLFKTEVMGCDDADILYGIRCDNTCCIGNDLRAAYLYDEDAIEDWNKRFGEEEQPK